MRILATTISANIRSLLDAPEIQRLDSNRSGELKIIIQNKGIVDIEISQGAEDGEVIGEGIVISPDESFSFSDSKIDDMWVVCGTTNDQIRVISI